MTDPRPSLLVGSDILGWQEFGEVAVLGSMTRAMPGGDGSLEFIIPGIEAGKRRNVLRASAEVVLDAGDDTWSGLIVGDPMAGYYAAQPLVSVAATGLWSQAANRRDVAWEWTDSDAAQWFRIRQKYDSGAGELVDLEDQGKFLVDTEGRLYIRADKDRAYDASANARLGYWLLDGLDLGLHIVGLTVQYKCNLPTDWEVRFRSVDDPWGTTVAEATETASRAAWYTRNIDLATPNHALQVNLYNAGGAIAAGSMASNPYVWARIVSVYCRMDGAAVDRLVTLDAALGDLATLPGLATTLRVASLGNDRDQLALRPDSERSVADGLRELADLHDASVEHFFDRAAGSWRFTANEVPTAVDPTRNRHWVFDDGRAGEDTSGVMRDPETAPEYLRVLYRSSGVATVPNGHPRSYCYPSEPPDFLASVQVNTDSADLKLTDAQAIDVAARLHAQMNAASFAGQAELAQMAVTVSGQELPSRLIRPGDRVNILGREGATDLYVSETSYDWSTEKMSVTIGWPFDVRAVPQLPKYVMDPLPWI